VLTRGPVHEAFAETVTFDPEPGIVVPKAPPAAIEELPPDQRPEGANVAWIPGYWGWDDERSDFLWVSGVWRALPPARQWVPGYWGSSQQGAQWTSGYWADATASAVEYLPAPPATLEVGPNIAAQFGLHVPAVHDAGQSVTRAPLAVSRLPTLLIVDADGMVRRRIDEPTERDYDRLADLTKF
jgi:hypothetical protein